MTKPTVLLLGEIDQEWKDSIESVATVLEPKARSRAEFLEEAKLGAFDEVVAAYRTFGSVVVTGLIDEELVAALPAKLKFICHNGAGYDQIDVNACTARGIRVSNVPTAVDDATADTNMFLILGALRGFNTCQQALPRQTIPPMLTSSPAAMLALREGHFKGSTPPPLGHDPQGKVLGILGMGGIGRNLMKKAAVFGMTTQYHNRTRLPEELSGGARYVSFEDLLKTSDVLSLNLPLNKQTRHIISGREFEMMKPGVVIVNTARGAVMDEEALVKALQDGQVWSCGLDVYEEEPKVHPGLIANPHVMLVPHMGTWTVETQTKMEVWCLNNLRSALEKGELVSPVSEQRDM
ncbi:hypothetical protein B2J93_2502 [Marssonina coronariae]|uniref:Glyoxylate reductase n=1 Tax=Diplocarpon coronariae TaxID=2795749 RepID=A0A218ZET2_9HELO|nr:hypothetical protein B2J93_2502 [Marssonina coronariae]